MPCNVVIIGSPCYFLTRSLQSKNYTVTQVHNHNLSNIAKQLLEATVLLINVEMDTYQVTLQALLPCVNSTQLIVCCSYLDDDINVQRLLHQVPCKWISLRLGALTGVNSHTKSPLNSMLRSCLLTGRMEVKESRKLVYVLWDRDYERAINSVLNARSYIPNGKTYNVYSFSSTVAKLANNIASRTNCVIDWNCEHEQAQKLAYFDNNVFSKDFYMIFQGTFTSILEDLYTNVTSLLTLDEVHFITTNPLPQTSVQRAPLKLSNLPHVLLLSHFYNEEVMLRAWIRSNSMHAEQAILLDYDSNDRSLAIIADEAPDNWKVVASANKVFDLTLAEKEIMEYEANNRKNWTIVLTCTELIVHPCLRHYLTTRLADVIRFKAFTLVGPTNKEWLDNVPVAQQCWLYNLYCSANYSRYMHRLHTITYKTGRHVLCKYDSNTNTTHKLEIPYDQCEKQGFICKALGVPYPYNMQRKIQTQSRIPNADLTTIMRNKISNSKELQDFFDSIYSYGPALDLSETIEWQEVYGCKKS